MGTLSNFPIYTIFPTVDHEYSIFYNRSGVGTMFVVDCVNYLSPVTDRADTCKYHELFHIWKHIVVHSSLKIKS